jgi:DNA-binding MarR family transcriptional regulator
MSASPGSLITGLLDGFMWFDGALQSNLDTRGWGGVRRLESMIMIHLHAGARRPAELARLIGVTRQSMNTALRELEAKQLVRLVADPTDRRCRRVEFAPEGAAMRREAQAIMQGLRRHLEQRLGADVLAELERILALDWGEPPMLDAGRDDDARGGA